MRLRDLAGLIVIDFIDMSDNNYIQQVERRLRDSTKTDRARIQLGRISQFGLMELSRQRLRPSIIETYTTTCAHCHGTGLVHSIESTALRVLRAIESLAIRGLVSEITAFVPVDIDLYLLNQKRSHIVSIESKYNVSIQIVRDMTLVAPAYRLDSVVDKERNKTLTKPELPQPIQLQHSAVEGEDEGEKGEEEREVKRRSGRNRWKRKDFHTKSNNQHVAEQGVNLVDQIVQEVIVDEILNEPAKEGDGFSERKKNYNQKRRERQRFNRNRRRHNRPEREGAEVRVSDERSPSEIKRPDASVVGGSEGGDEKKKKKGWLRRLLD
jgi:ribonuclease E